MKSKAVLGMGIVMLSAAFAQAYLIQGVDLEVEYWAGSGENETLIAVDWNQTNGPYNSPFHIFGYRWQDGTQPTVKDALQAVDLAGDLLVTYGYGGGYINHMLYDRTADDGDDHTTLDFGGWWWSGQTDDGGLTWQDNAAGIDTKYVRNGGIEAFNINGTNWGSASMTIPEPATVMLLAVGMCLLKQRKEEKRTKA